MACEPVNIVPVCTGVTGVVLLAPLLSTPMCFQMCFCSGQSVLHHSHSARRERWPLSSEDKRKGIYEKVKDLGIAEIPNIVITYS